MADLLDQASTLAARITALSREHGLSVLLRHSIREKITTPSLAEAIAAPLTDAGRGLAREFGAMLPLDRRIRLFFSPVPRCEETARCVAEGHKGQGGTSKVQGVRGYLGARFVRSPRQMIDLMAEAGPEGVVRSWFRGEIDVAVLDAPSAAGRDLLDRLTRERTRRAPTGIDVHVTHDLTIAALAGLFVDMTAADLPWPGYLEGIIVVFDGERPSFWYRGERHRWTG